MIVGCSFEGDSIELAWKQHEVYGEALHIIVSSIYEHPKRAAEMLGLANHHVPAEARDHRTMQMAHDILAAAWRHQSEPADMFAEKPDQSMYGWFCWLRAECDSWHRSPEIVRLFLTIFENQNNDVGYAAEDALSRALLLRFDKVPWEDRLLRAFT